MNEHAGELIKEQILAKETRWHRVDIVNYRIVTSYLPQTRSWQVVAEY